jgi:hypothetical protein
MLGSRLSRARELILMSCRGRVEDLEARRKRPEQTLALFLTRKCPEKNGNQAHESSFTACFS